MISRTLRNSVQKQLGGVRFSSHALPAGFGIAKAGNPEPIVKKCIDQVKSENLSGDAYEARLKQLLSAENYTLYHTNPEKGREFVSNYEHTKEHGEQTASLWKKISIFVFIPALVLSSVNSYFVEAEHAKHREHVYEHGGPEVQYPYQKLLIKDFFWGDGNKSLFWNEKANFNKKEE